jgi:TonB family protein
MKINYLKFFFLTGIIWYSCFSQNTYSQSNTAYDTVYLNKKFENVAVDQAVYYKVTNTINNLEFPYISITFLMNGKPYLLQHYDNKHTLHGFYQEFYSNGKVFMEGNYKRGKRTGLWKKYYSNGTLMEEFEVVKTDFYPDGSDQRNVLSFFDSSGVKQVHEGTGLYTEYDNQMQPRHMGTYKQYQKTGNWIGYASDGSKYYEEKYVNGNLIKGTSYDRTGEAYTYRELIVNAQPYGSLESFYANLRKQIKYPEYAKDFLIEGKIFCKFSVDEKGVITDLKILKGGNSELETETLRAVRNTPAWKPCMYRGQPSPLQFVVPVVFKIQ